MFGPHTSVHTRIISAAITCRYKFWITDLLLGVSVFGGLHFSVMINRWAIHYESKIHSGYIEGTDIQHIFSLFGASKQSKSPVCPIPSLHRKFKDYKDYAKEIQFLLRSSVQHLGIVVRIFGDSLSEELSQIRTFTESLLSECDDLSEVSLSARRLLTSIKSAQLVFDRASEVHGHITLLSECVDDAQEDQTRLLGSCLIEPAEDETFYSFAHYSDAVFSNDCREWINVLAQIPHITRTLTNEFQRILRVTLTNASSRRHAEIKLRFSDPHSCQLCTTSFTYDSVNLTAPGQPSEPCYALPHQSDISQSYWPDAASGYAINSCAGRGVSSTYNSSDNVTSLSLPFCSLSTNQQFFNSPSFTSFTNPRQQKPTDHSSNTKHSTSPRSVSISPLPLQLAHKSIPDFVNNDRIQNQTEDLTVRTSDYGLSTSSSSSAINDDGMKAAGDNECSLNEKVFSDDTDNYSSGTGSFKEGQAQLMELLHFSFDLTTVSPSCSHMVIAFRYLLPQLLLLPNLQLLQLADHIEALRTQATEESEQAILRDVMSILSKTRSSVSATLFNQDWVKLVYPKLSFLMKTPLSDDPCPAEGKSRLEELICSVRRIQHPSELPLVMSEFIMEGRVQIRTDHNRPKKCERMAYLFNNWLLLCKKQKRVLSNVVSTSSSSANYVMKVKSRICLEQFHLIDLAPEVNDNNEVTFSFDLEFWEAPKLSSVMSGLQHDTANSSFNLHSCNNPTASSGELQSVFPGTLNQSQFQVGSVLSVSTLTSTNTLVDNSPDSKLNLTSGNAESNKSLILPTAEDAATASNNALIDVISSYPKQRFTFIFLSREDKANWMSALVYLHLSRLFKRYLMSLPRQDLPLILPSPSIYRYAVPDSPLNIILEPPQTDGSSGIPIVRAATILKLIERMTYHEYFDSKTLNAFLLTYRRYVTALELLDLLIERFNIPNPDFTEAANEKFNSVKGSDCLTTAAWRLEQRFRSVYKRRVQYRVLNFIIKWVKNSSYYKLDILPDATLRSKLWSFLDTVDARNLSDNVANIRKSLLGDRIRSVPTIQQLPPEPLDFGLAMLSDDVKLTTVHPLELARQVTLYEWELYSRIEFWEVTGKEKIKSPNFEASLQFSNKFKWWLVSSIMSAHHLEDRMVVMQRVADLLTYFEHLNNLQGVQEAKAALLSSPVFRLSETYEALISKSKQHYRNLFECLRQSVESDNGNIYFDDYQEKLHRIHPPGLPFIAVGDKTQLIHLELKHSDWVNPSSSPFVSVADVRDSNSNCLINFWKCRQLAELVEYYLSFQQTPYNFSINKPIRNFLETLDPLKSWGVESENAFDDIMYEKSLKIQPKLGDTSSTASRERSFTPVELKIAAALNLVQPDPNLTADSREFRNLVQMISTVKNCSSSTTNENQLVKVSSDLSDKTFERSSSKLNTTVCATINESAVYPQNSEEKSSLLSEADKICIDLKPSIIGDSYGDLRVTSPTVAKPKDIERPPSVPFDIKCVQRCEETHAKNSSPPPLPPRISKYSNVNTHSEQLFRQPSPSQGFHNYPISTSLHHSNVCCTTLPAMDTLTICSTDSHISYDCIAENSSKLQSSSASQECGNAPMNETPDSVSPPPRPSRRSLISVSSRTLPTERNCSPSCEATELSGFASRSLNVNTLNPPTLPPRNPSHKESTVENADIHGESVGLSNLANPTRVFLSHNTTITTDRSSPPPLPPKKISSS
ncbi:unnamed protein product [Trichobilharzia szidati]|nr:unnamed protein product [Trichobilharzia szidati]